MLVLTRRAGQGLKIGGWTVAVERICGGRARVFVALTHGSFRVAGPAGCIVRIGDVEITFQHVKGSSTLSLGIDAPRSAVIERLDSVEFLRAVERLDEILQRKPQT